MGSVVSRLWQAFNPPAVEKSDDALKFGILGAAKSAPLTLTMPATSHPEVVVQAIAARDRQRAEAFAKKHGIPEVKDSYQEIIDDPNIDCVLIPLPNALHYEWAARAIRAGKHVFVEKPSVSNGTEAEALFNLPELSKPNAPILVEAFHNHYHPAWVFFRTLITPTDVVHVDTYSMIPWWGVSKKDIYFDFSLAGGSIMQMGAYNFAAMREAFGSEPEECLSCKVSTSTADKIDDDFTAKFRFPNGGIGEAHATLKGPTVWKLSYITVTHKATKVPDKQLSPSQTKFRTREVTMTGFIHAIVWHRIDVKDVYEIRGEDGKTVKKWEEKKSHKAYLSGGTEGVFSAPSGEGPFWMSYRYQLEEFVNRAKGRDTRAWFDGKSSVHQMKMIDMAYEKSGLGSRPSGQYKST